MNSNPEPKQLTELARTIKQWGRELGFDEVAISDLDIRPHDTYLRQWLAARYHGSMRYMENHAELRCNPERLQAGTLKAITVRLNYYYDGASAKALLGQPLQAYIARYALGRDYHKLMRKRLSHLAERIRHELTKTQAATTFDCRAFVDSAPVLERALAQRSGQGWIGKNTMLLNPRAGSWFFLGELFTNLDLPCDPPQASTHCGSCQSCLEVCPTQAFTAPWQLDARRCISYLTIEHNGSIPTDLRPLMGNRIFGCDDCQLFCPWNKFAQSTELGDFQPRHQLDNSRLTELFLWDEATFLSRTEGSPIRRTGYENWLRNLAVALGNAPSSIPVVEALKQRREHPSEIVQEHVNWALAQHQTL